MVRVEDVFDKRPYQKAAADFLIRRGGRGGLRAPTGAGKTIISLMVLEALGFQDVLILAPRYSALLTWRKKLEAIGLHEQVDIIVVEKWNKQRRHTYWAHKPERRRIVLALYPTAHKDILEMMESPFDFVLCDESHRIKDHRSKWFSAANALCRGRKFIWMSGSMETKGAQDLYSLLHTSSPKVFSSYWKFVNKYFIVDDGNYGKEILGPKKSTLKELKERIAGFVFNISQKECDGFVPKRQRMFLPVEMERKVAKVYRQLEEEMLAELPNGEFVISQNSMVKSIRLRQLLCCPSIIEPSLGVGQAFKDVMEHIKSNNNHAVIYTPFVEAIHRWRKELKGAKKTKTFACIGGMSSTDTDREIAEFGRCKGKDTSVLFISIAGAESYDILSTDSGYFIGYDWRQELNYQAEGRLTRGDKAFCNFWYACHEQTIDTHMLSVLTQKVRKTSILTKR